MKELIEDDQETEFILSLYGSSEQYELREAFNQLLVPSNEWFDMTEDQRRKKVSSVYSASMEQLYEIGDDRNSQVRALSSSIHPIPPESKDLSLPPSSVTSELDYHIAAQIWLKAKKIVNEKDSIFSAPSRDESVQAFSVISESSNIPNFVQIYRGSRMSCTCRNYKPKKICSHVVSVADNQNMLSNFVAWFIKQKKIPQVCQRSHP